MGLGFTDAEVRSMWSIASKTMPAEHYDLNVLGLGAGNDSSGLLLSYLNGDLQKWLGYDIHLDCAIFADTGWEPSGGKMDVYKHVAYLESVCNQYEFPLYRVQVGDIKEDMEKLAAGLDGHLSTPPMFTMKDGEAVMLSRRCTSDYKTVAIRKKIRELLGGKTAKKRVLQWFGIPVDEIHRMRTSDVQYIDHYYPLVEADKTKNDIAIWTVRNGYKSAPKSACVCCPFHSDEYWRELKHGNPEQFEDACRIEDGIYDKLPGVKGTAYFHRSCKPLREIDFDNDDQLKLFDMAEECGGYCGV